MPNTINVFVSYAHKDQTYLEELKTALVLLERDQSIKLWTDGEIIAGQEWDQAIKGHLNSAALILFLISRDFINSDYINRVEIKDAIERYNKGEVKIVPIIIRPCDFGSLPISKFQALPKAAKPISKWDDQDDAWLDVTQQMRTLVKQMQGDDTTTSASSKPAISSNPLLSDTTQSSSSITYQDIRNLVGQGKLEKALEALLEKSKGMDDHHNTIVLLSSRYNSNQRSKTMGIISDANANMANNQITYALLGLIDEVEG